MLQVGGVGQLVVVGELVGVLDHPRQLQRGQHRDRHPPTEAVAEAGQQRRDDGGHVDQAQAEQVEHGAGGGVEPPGLGDAQGVRAQAERHQEEWQSDALAGRNRASALSRRASALSRRAGCSGAGDAAGGTGSKYDGSRYGVRGQRGTCDGSRNRYGVCGRRLGEHRPAVSRPSAGAVSA